MDLIMPAKPGARPDFSAVAQHGHDLSCLCPRVATLHPYRAPMRDAALEFLAFGLKQVRACTFVGLFFAAVFLMPRAGAFGIPRYDLLLLYAIAVQAGMLLCKLETFDELKAICLFHAVGFLLEVFNTSSDVASLHRGFSLVHRRMRIGSLREEHRHLHSLAP